MTSPTRRLLVIEDQTSWETIFRQKITQVGESRPLEFLGLEFQERFTTPRDFDDIDACFVDLELGAGVRAKRQDTFGLTRILPHIRRIAPWMPTACISRYIEGDDAQIVGDLSAADFDYFCPKSTIAETDGRTNPEFNATRWHSILRAMLIKRNSAMTGRPVVEVNQDMEIGRQLIAPAKIRDAMKALDLSEVAMLEALSIFGIQGSEFVLDPIVPGFSGVNVSRLTASGFADDLPVHSHWLIKWGRPLSKLHQEASAHRRLQARGIPRALQIPQVVPGVVLWSGVGFIAYAFEQAAKDGFAAIAGGGISALLEPLAYVAAGLYRPEHVRQKAIVRDVTLEEWCATSAQDRVNAGIRECDVTWDITWGLIHGDFHLRNLFANGDQATLIDFARSEPGPLAIDAAKLAIDILAFAPSIESWPGGVVWEDLLESSVGPVLRIFDRFMQRPDDHKFLEDATRATALRYLTYSDVSEDRKKQLRAMLSSSV